MISLMPQQLIFFPVPSGAPCLSLYATSPEELDDLMIQARDAGRAEIAAAELDRLFRPARRWRRENPHFAAYPVAIFVTRGFSGYLSIPFAVQGIQVVSWSFHVKPLLKWQQRERPFTLLQLGSTSASLYQGSLSALALRETIEYRELRTLDGVFHALDRAVYRTVQSSRTPLLLAGPADQVENYRNVSGYRAILEETIPTEPGAQDAAWLHRQALRLLEPHFERCEDGYLEQYRHADRSGKSCSSLPEVVDFALAGKVKLLLVSEAMHLWGRIDEESGQLTYRPGKPDGTEDDILDDLAEIVLRRGGEVAVLPGMRMPGGRAACAVLRGVVPVQERAGIDRVAAFLRDAPIAAV